MSGKLRYWAAGGMLLFLGFLSAIAPSRQQVFAAQSQKLLEGMLVEVADSLKGSPGRFAFRAEAGNVSPKTLQQWDKELDRWVADAKGQEPPLDLVIAADGKPLVLTWNGSERTVRLTTDGVVAERMLADFRSLLPPFVTILIAVVFGKTILALLIGVALGAFLYVGYSAPVHFVDAYLVGNILGDDFKLKILAFVLFLSMTVGIMSKCGGIDGMIELVRRFARTARSSQLVTWCMGLLIFFDDYANTIVVGSTMRPLTDRLRVSREKLAYIVDSTAAPVAGLSLLSTWVAYEITMFAPTLPEVTNAAGRAYTEAQGFQIFLETLPYRFYCILTLCMVVLTIVLRREFGPMLRAERRARHEGKPIEDDATPLVSAALTETKTKPGAPRRWWNGLIPIAVLLAVTIEEIWRTGREGAKASESLFDQVRGLLGKADSAHAIFVGSGCAAGVAALLAIGQRILTFAESLATSLKAIGALFFAVVILILAWSMGKVCSEEVGTAYYLVALTEGRLPALLLPTILFLLSCLISFSIGSSWSTMAILLPNVVVLAHGFGVDTDLGGPVLMVLTIGAVLEGSIFGDHCSPISDTTVLSSVSCASDHLHHVRTQAPYAMLVMIVSMVVGYLPMAFISPKLWPLSLIVGVTAITSFLLWRGRDPETAGPLR